MFYSLLPFFVEPEVSISDIRDHHKWILRPLKPLYTKFHDDPEVGLFYTIDEKTIQAKETLINQRIITDSDSEPLNIFIENIKRQELDIRRHYSI